MLQSIQESKFMSLTLSMSQENSCAKRVDFELMGVDNNHPLEQNLIQKITMKLISCTGRQQTSAPKIFVVG